LLLFPYPHLTFSSNTRKLIALNNCFAKRFTAHVALLFFQKKIVSFCPYGEFECGEQWENGAIIFTDDNNNGIIDEDDELLEKIDFKAANFNISWRASGRKNYLRYSPTGMARAFGRFTLCEKSKDLRLARTIVINRQGRLREYYDRNSDGIVEDIDGRKPDCR
jgi:type IV fimbrial biogenesis protein FimT